MNRFLSALVVLALSGSAHGQSLRSDTLRAVDEGLQRLEQGYRAVAAPQYQILLVRAEEQSSSIREQLDRLLGTKKESSQPQDQQAQPQSQQPQTQPSGQQQQTQPQAQPQAQPSGQSGISQAQDAQKRAQDEQQKAQDALKQAQGAQKTQGQQSQSQQSQSQRGQGAQAQAGQQKLQPPQGWKNIAQTVEGGVLSARFERENYSQFGEKKSSHHQAVLVRGSDAAKVQETCQRELQRLRNEAPNGFRIMRRIDPVTILVIQGDVPLNGDDQILEARGEVTASQYAMEQWLNPQQQPAQGMAAPRSSEGAGQQRMP